MHVPELQPPGVRVRSTADGMGASSTIGSHHSTTSAQSQQHSQHQQHQQQHAWEPPSYLPNQDTAGAYQHQPQPPLQQLPAGSRPQHQQMGPGSFSQPSYYPAGDVPKSEVSFDYNRWVELYNQGQYSQDQPYYQSQSVPETYPQGGYDADIARYGGDLAPSSSAYLAPSSGNHDSLAPPAVNGPSSSDLSSEGTHAFNTPSSDAAALPRTSMSPISVSLSGNFTSPTRPKAERSPARSAANRKRRKAGAEHSDDSDEEGLALPLTASVGTEFTPQRLPGACTHCKKLKMKCEFPPDANVCRRCRSSGHTCIVQGRKPRSAPNKREYLLGQLKQKDAVIESLLKQIRNPHLSHPTSIATYRASNTPDPHDANVRAWLARVSLGPGAAGAHHLAPPARPRSPASDDARTDGSAAPDDDSGGSSAESGGLVRGPDALIPDAAFPVGLFANLSLGSAKRSARARAAAGAEGNDEDDVGIANEMYFLPGPATDLRIRQRVLEQTSPPEILVHGLVTPDDVEKLFDLFFKRINIFFPLLDPVLHTPATTFSRSPFLFTAICAISSRYLPEKAHIYPVAMHFAKSEAGSALINGWKSVELCQAYILMAIYGTPAKRWEEDRGWILTGLAIRVAMDLNLHIPQTARPHTEKQTREALNRTRAWLICYNMDRSTGSQFGKPCTIKDDYIEYHPPDFYRSSPYNNPYDVQLCAYNALLRIVGEIHCNLYSGRNAALGLNKDLEFQSVIPQYDAQLTQFYNEWYQRIEEHKPVKDDPVYAMRSQLLPFVVSYSRLILYSFSFQQAFVRGVQPSDRPVLLKCLEAAKSVVEVMINRLAPTGLMRFAPDGWFLMTSFASAFLFKLLRPQLRSLMSQDHEVEILELIGKLIQTLSSSEIAIDDRHTPRVYARFFSGLLSKHRREGLSETKAPPVASSSQLNGHLPHDQPPAFSEPRTHGGYPQLTGWQAPVQESVQQNVDYGVPPPSLLMNGHPFMSTPDLTSDLSEDSSLASMAALRNPAWWDGMMLPGFSWPTSPIIAMNNTGFPNSMSHGNMAQHPMATSLPIYP